MVRPILSPTVVLAFYASALLAIAQSNDEAVLVTVTMNPDGSKTVYQTDGAKREATATTTEANGKAQGKIIYQLDAEGRYESGRVFAPNGSLRFKTSYRYDAAGRLAEETQLAKDDSIRNKIVYSYDAAGHQAGYAVYDGEGRLLGRTSERKEKVTQPGAVFAVAPSTDLLVRPFAGHARATCQRGQRELSGLRMIDYIQKGGLLMWPILVCSIISIAVFAERLFYFHRATIHVGEFLQGLSNLLQRRNFAEALHECAGTPGPVARVIHAAIIRHDAPRAELREIVQEAGQLEVPKLERFLGVLATLAYLTPLIGLLGTVAGMIEAFGVVSSNGGYATVTELSTGIYKSLLTTAAGLVVATPTFVGYSYLSSRVNTLLHDMERAGIEVVHMLTDHAPSAEIISFAQGQEKAALRRGER